MQVGLPRRTLEREPSAHRRGAAGILGRAALRGVHLGLGLLCGIGIGLLAWAAVGVFRSGAHRPTAPLDQLTVPLSGKEPALQPLPAWSDAVAVPSGDSLVAQAHVAKVAVYRSARAMRPKLTLSNPNADGAPLAFLVVAARPKRLRVLLPTRPNFSSGWIDRREVRLAVDPYRITVHLARHRMILWRAGVRFHHYRIGVGRRAVTPTPFGLYYITELLKQPNPNGVYGPYAFGLSAHSNVLHEFAGGNGEIGIHGTDEPSAIGKNVSHGCIRVYNRVVRMLAHELPLGTPVQIEQ